MELVDYLTIGAIIIGPIASVQIQKYLERRKETRNEKVRIFRVLMGTRGSSLSKSHVEALNQIDLVFEDKKYQSVRLAWGEYLDNLNQPFNDNNFSIWVNKNEDLLANLLYEMGLALGFNYDKVTIKRKSYTPVGHSNIELENQSIRKGILELLQSERTLPMQLILSQEELDNQKELRDLMLKYYENELKKEN
ncbi:DUF6680 family protein [Draconibacterium sp.]|uniref:DUF6680 family protein n=1 Tax=Draconibacterium sp. TaxID=1965318 RepID=UPI0035638BE3